MAIRRIVARLLPPLVVLAVACGLGYAEAQQVLRASANDPQVQLAEDAAAALDTGAEPAVVVGPGSAVASLAGQATVDLRTSLAPFVAVYDLSGTPVASNGTLDGKPPMPPAGVLEAARASGRDTVTWQPQASVRIAAVAVPWAGGTVLAGRSLREVEAREDNAFRLALAAALAGAITLVGAVLVAELLARAPARNA